MSNTTDIQTFISSLEAGVFKEKVSHLLSDVALGQVVHGAGNRKGKLTIDLTFQRVGENNQVMISSKLTHTTLTRRGSKSETASNETPFYVGKGGVLTIEQPQEEFNGQFTLVQQN
ncbi:hypothetical protein N473_01460 [Pseudoalteromonas luteoviolacea CPMOR-1]|uniref:Uncharacterized protein n=1 Tax=Pseudoalteromonas luteoviolacea CPMOR-1 TaxID=1365248 RepID=A0A167LRD2_9GAMM|nr:hypothetical protein [Pseudoalteromonas luteoviolacea]KZN65065.1 hypothetical protein N473_01460 [Pseudoalteromonas luteoviolacea CPMOR-1]